VAVKPSFQRYKKLASAPYQGWHFWWGPLHLFWTLGHDRMRRFGIYWRMHRIARADWRV